MKKIKYLLIVLVFVIPNISLSQIRKELKIDFKPKQYDLSNKERFTDEIDGLYKYWKYIVFSEYSDLNSDVEDYSIQFLQKNFESEKFYPIEDKGEINWYMPSSDTFYVASATYADGYNPSEF